MTELADGNLLYRKPWLYDELGAGDRSRVELVLRLVERYGRPGAASVLDLGCGTGRDLAELSGSAHRFAGVGVDAQPGMVRFGRKVRPHLDLRVGDLRSFRLGRPVDVILCLGNVLAYLHRDDDLDAAFATFAAHATAGTLLIVQTMVAARATAPRTATVEILGRTAEVTTSSTVDTDTSMATTSREWCFRDGERAADLIRRRLVGRDELRSRLHLAGFDTLVAAGDPTDPEATTDVPVTYAVATARSG